MTAVEQDVVTTGTMGQWLGSATTEDNKQVLAYTSGIGNQIYAATQSATGWSSELVRTSAVLASPIEVLIDQGNNPVLLYRHNATDQLEMAIGGASWVLEALGDEGDARSLQHPAVMLANQSVAVGLVASNGTGTNLAVWILSLIHI